MGARRARSRRSLAVMGGARSNARPRALPRERLSPVAGGFGGVLVVGDLVAPVRRDVLVVDLVEGYVDHEAVRYGAVPVVLVWLEEDAVAGADDLDGAVAALREADPLCDVDGLAEWVRVPTRCARRA